MRQQRSEETTGARWGHACCNLGPVGVSPTSGRKWFGSEVTMMSASSPKVPENPTMCVELFPEAVEQNP